MPQRLTGTARIDAARVQGDGAWVELRRATWGENKAVAAWAAEDEDEAARLIEGFLAGRILAWNWVDGDGRPLPPPTESGWLDQLTREEISFLIQAAK